MADPNTSPGFLPWYGGFIEDLANATEKYEYNSTAGNFFIRWKTDAWSERTGFTLIYYPDYEKLDIKENSDMLGGQIGLLFYPTYHYPPDDEDNVIEGEDGTKKYIETPDWIVPNVTCTSTSMHCPLPDIWAHINYSTPTLYPEPAEGSCLQMKNGTSSLYGCGDKMIWPGNCGDATSYFWFEKIACGSERWFDTSRSLIIDTIMLKPLNESMNDILEVYYTTKAPLGTGAGAFVFVTQDYHIAPLMPPDISCTCYSPMTGYASLLAVQSNTPTPGAPVTIDPEVLNSGTSRIVAWLRAYQEPTYSVPTSASAPLPLVVERFFIEVGTKFTRNRITVAMCKASSNPEYMNSTSAVRPLLDYCHNSTFDSMDERRLAMFHFWMYRFHLLCC